MAQVVLFSAAFRRQAFEFGFKASHVARVFSDEPVKHGFVVLCVAVPGKGCSGIG